MSALQVIPMFDSPESVLKAYEGVKNITVRMLICARDGDWDTLIDKQSEYLAAIESLNDISLQPRMTEDQVSRKAELIRDCLENNRDITQLLIGRRTEIEDLIASEKNKKSLNNAYGHAGDFTAGPRVQEEARV